MIIDTKALTSWHSEEVTDEYLINQLNDTIEWLQDFRANVQQGFLLPRDMTAYPLARLLTHMADVISDVRHLEAPVNMPQLQVVEQTIVKVHDHIGFASDFDLTPEQVEQYRATPEEVAYFYSG